MFTWIRTEAGWEQNFKGRKKEGKDATYFKIWSKVLPVEIKDFSIVGNIASESCREMDNISFNDVKI